MPKLVKFTNTDYPNGYSRNDCLVQLERATVEFYAARKRLKKLEAEIKELKIQLRDGGRHE